MGMAITKEEFTEQDYRDFDRVLHQQLAELRELLAGEGMSEGPPSLGAELEMYLLDRELQPCPDNLSLIERMADPQLVEELNRFNLEYNLSPVMAQGRPFHIMADDLRGLLCRLQAEADTKAQRIVPIGILPTLSRSHLNQECMTDLCRYRVLSKQLLGLRGSAFQIQINGEDPLSCTGNDVTLEGANTSFQVHLRVPANRFAQLFNAAQATTPLVLALAGNSPTLLGHRLWQETRVALFKQSIDARHRGRMNWRVPARVSFGNGWVRDGAWELFAENVSLHTPLFPILAENPVPNALAELRLHHGTCWNWNRAVYDPKPSPHLRIEYRALPAGPTVADMMANAALAVGWTMSLAEDIDHLLTALPFSMAEYNFYRCAEQGLDANIIWPDKVTGRPAERPVAEVIRNLLPMAASGLARIGVDDEEIGHVLAIVEGRLSNGQTGSRWQLNTLAKLETRMSRPEALKAMLQRYIDNQQEGRPVAQWP